MSDDDGPGLARRRILNTVAGVVGFAGCLGGDGSGDGRTDTTVDGGGPTGTEATTSSGDDGPGPAVTDLTPADCEGETVSDAITTDTTWSVGECPRVVLSGSVEIRDGATLTIEPGVEVVGSGREGLQVGDTGTLRATGDPTNPVWFHGENLEAGDWAGIGTEGGGTVTLDNVVVEHGGKGSAGTLTVRKTSRASVTDCLFRRSNGAGLAVKDDARLTEFANNAFRSNDGYAVRTGAANVGTLDSASNYAGDNDPDAIFVSGGTVESEGNWPATSIHLSRIAVEVAAPVTVEPGAHVTGLKKATIAVVSGGSLTAEGESDAPIRFEGATAEQGHWQGITSSGDAAVTLSNVVVADGGAGTPGNLTLRGTSTATVTDSTFRRSNNYGIFVDEDASLDASNNTFENNANGGIGGPGA